MGWGGGELSICFLAVVSGHPKGKKCSRDCVYCIQLRTAMIVGCVETHINNGRPSFIQVKKNVSSRHFFIFTNKNNPIIN